MTRHSRNNTDSGVYSYHERKKDSAKSGFGSVRARLSKDAVKEFDCCSITLHPCRDPVVSPDGYLFEREAILEYIISKKNEIKNKIKEYEKQCNKEKAELLELGEAEQRTKLEKFLKAETNVVPSAAGTSKDVTLSFPDKNSIKSNSLSNMSSDKSKKLPSFWIPDLTPQSSKSKIAPPDKTVYCPISNKPIRMKDLIPVKFTLADSSTEKKSLDGKTERYKCPVTGDTLRSNVPCAVLKPTGDIVTLACVDLIRKDMQHPLTGQKLTEKDIIPLNRGGTGFAAVNENLVARKEAPVMQV